jgi:hypothetical protein
VRKIQRDIPPFDHGTYSRKRSNYYEIEIKRGLGTPGNTEPVFEMQVQDDSKPWSDVQFFGLGFTGDNNHYVKARFPGIYRKRQIRIICTDGIDFRLKSIKEDVDLMTS